MSNDISIVTSNMPAHVKQGNNLGNENISSEHLSTPRLKQLQQLSNEVDENHSEYIDGAKVGDFINTVTKENYGKELYLVNVHFKEEFVVWKQLEKGGGLVGTFPTQDKALEHLESENLKVEDYDINRTQTHTLLKVDEKSGDISEIPFLFDCAISKLRVSREWNTQIMKLGGDRFASLWKMASVQTANKTGQRFMNIAVSNVGWLKEETYNVAKSFYEKTFANNS
jgi:hypothetical protein|tara:strand:- start:3795 stop:4472 length:678 start_codon:yes stop_codon:yes gene_type:complete